MRDFTQVDVRNTHNIRFSRADGDEDSKSGLNSDELSKRSLILIWWRYKKAWQNFSQQNAADIFSEVEAKALSKGSPTVKH